MLQFLVKRFIGFIFVVLGVTLITFTLGFFSPDDPIRVQMGIHFNYVIWMRLRHQYGLDLPFWVQYWNYLVHLAHFDLGTSFHTRNHPVWDVLKDGVPITLELATWGTLITIFVGVPTGILSAIKANTWIDTTNMSIALIFYALPVFVFAVFAQVLILWINNQTGGSWPVSDWGNPWQYTLGDLQSKLVPTVVYGLAGYAYISRLARTTMLEVLRQDYVRTARAKGLAERTVIYRHALRNALIPLVTVLGYLIGYLAIGTFFIEGIFNIHGIAQISISSIFNRDYPVIQATTILVALCVVLGNLISDLLYTVVDPRIKLS